MATKLIQKSATSKAASSTQNSGACFQAETTAVWTETTAVEARSAKRRGASAGTRSPKRVQLEIFSQNESATDLDRIPSDRIKQEPLSCRKPLATGRVQPEHGKEWRVPEPRERRP